MSQIDVDFLQKQDESLRAYLIRIETVKNLMKDGKYIVAFEKIQGIGDGLANMRGSILKRIEEVQSVESNPKQ